MNPTTIIGPTIQTFTGRYFNLVSPDPWTITIEDIAHALSNVCRFAGHCRTFYSVAQHSLVVSRSVSPERALEALLHDAAEAYCGDVTKPLKSVLPDYRKVQTGIELAIAKRFGLPPELDPEIKFADLVVLATERRDLMPKCLAEWECLAGLQPLPGRIEPLLPVDAEGEFLNRFRALGGPR